MACENYGFMAPIKAALDSSLAFLAKSFSQFSQVRFNAVAAGLLKTSASAGIPGYVDAYLFAEQVDSPPGGRTNRGSRRDCRVPAQRSVQRNPGPTHRRRCGNEHQLLRPRGDRPRRRWSLRRVPTACRQRPDTPKNRENLGETGHFTAPISVGKGPISRVCFTQPRGTWIEQEQRFSRLKERVEWPRCHVSPSLVHRPARYDPFEICVPLSVRSAVKGHLRCFFRESDGQSHNRKTA